MSVKKQFQNACKNGELEKAKQLLENNPNINISAHNEFAFQLACMNGHLHVAQWLLQTKPNINISTYDECAFKCACSYGHLHVAQWLQTVLPFKYVVVVLENNKLKSKIRNKPEEHLLHMLYMFTKNGYKNNLNAGFVLNMCA